MIWLLPCSLLVLRKQRRDIKVVKKEDCVVLTLRSLALKKEMNRLRDFEIFSFSLMKLDFNLILNRSNSICFFFFAVVVVLVGGWFVITWVSRLCIKSHDKGGVP